MEGTAREGSEMLPGYVTDESVALGVFVLALEGSDVPTVLVYAAEFAAAPVLLEDRGGDFWVNGVRPELDDSEVSAVLAVFDFAAGDPCSRGDLGPVPAGTSAVMPALA